MPAVTVATDTFLDGGESLHVSNQQAYLIDSPGAVAAPSLYIDGVVTDDWTVSHGPQAYGGAGYYGVSVAGYKPLAGGVLHIGASGALHVTNTVNDGVTSAFYAGSWGPTLSNSGTLDVRAAGDAIGMQSWVGSLGGKQVNDGVLRVEAGGQALGMSLHNGGDVVNTGLIEAIGHGHSEVLTYEAQLGDRTNTIGVLNLGYSGSFTNTGTIRAHTDDASTPSIAVDWHDIGYSGAFDNRGTLEGDIALRVEQPGASRTPAYHNEGTMNGAVEFHGDRYSGGEERVDFVNSGHVNGAVSFDDTNDTYEGSAGVLTGPLDGGGGNDSIAGGADGERLIGGAGDDSISALAGTNYLRGDDGNDSIQGGGGFDDINGNKGDDTIDGGAAGGGDWLVGGQGNDLITAHVGGNILYGNIGNDTLNGGSGAEILRGGQNNDVILGGAGNDWLSGDRGDDTLTGGAGADIFHTFNGAGLDRVTDFSVAEGDRVQLDPGTTYTLTQVGADTIIDLGAGEKMVLSNTTSTTLPPGWIFGA